MLFVFTRFRFLRVPSRSRLVQAVVFLLGVDPLFVAWSDNGLDDDDLQLASGSPAIDAGAPASDVDSDGSPTDMGAYGGPDAW